MKNSMMKQLVVALVATFALSGAAFAEQAADEAGIKKLVADVEAAANKQDTGNARAKAVLAYATQDFTSSQDGDAPNNRADTEKAWTEGFGHGLKSATGKLTVRKIHSLQADVALVDIDQEFSNVIGDDGKPQTQNAHVVATVMKKNGKWLFSDIRQFYYSNAPAAASAAK